MRTGCATAHEPRVRTTKRMRKFLLIISPKRILKPYWYGGAAAFVSSGANHCDFVLVRMLEQPITVKHEGLAGGDREAGCTGGDHCFDRRQADDRYVKSHVLVGFRDLHHREFSCGK